MKLILQTRQSGRLFQSLPLFFLHDLWYNNTNEIHQASRRSALGWIFASQPRALSGNEKSGCQIGADQSPACLLAVRTMWETHNPPVFRLEHRGIFFANKAVKLSILASFYINILISLSAHADFSVWALFFFVLRCTFVVFQFLPMRYTGCIRRDVL